MVSSFSMDVDVSELLDLANDLRDAPLRVSEAVYTPVTKGAVNMRDFMQRGMKASLHFKGGGGSGFLYTSEPKSMGVEARVWVEHGRSVPSSLANIAFWGGSNGGGATVDGPDEAMAAESPALFKYVNDAAVKAVLG